MRPNLPSLFLLLLITTGPLLGQSSRTIVPATLNAQQSPTYEIPITEEGPFLSYFLTWGGPATQSHIRFSTDGRTWTDWQRMPRDEHAPDLAMSTLGSTSLSMRFFQLAYLSPKDAHGAINCHFYNPGQTERLFSATVPADAAGRSCSDLAQPYLQRSEWCPAGNCAEHPNPAFATVTHLVIHHSAGTNQSNDWPAVVRAIWDYHVIGRGWSDIGYNWLIDPNGQIYEGRSKDVIGAHFCGTNTGTIGICMLGDFTEKAPEAEAIAALKKLLSWKACENAIDPLTEVFHASSEKMLPTVIGHRDGCATACPGDLFYPLLPEIRTTLNADSTTPVHDQSAEAIFQVFPNPGRRNFQINLPEDTTGPVSCRLYDMNGQLVVGPILLNQNQKLALDRVLPTGTYLLVLHAANSYIGAKKLSILD